MRAKSVKCVVCSARFRLARADARYCSPACRQRAHRARATEDELMREIEATRRRYWQLVWQMQAHRGAGVLTSLTQVVDTAGNVYANNADPAAPFGCGQWVGQIKQASAGFVSWGLEAAGPPFKPPPGKREDV